MLMAPMTCVSPLRLLAVTLAAGQVVSEGLGLVDRLLLALRVVRVDPSRCRVAGRLAATEALAPSVHIDGRGVRSRGLRRRGLALAAGQVVSEGLGLVDRLLFAFRVVRVVRGRRRVAGRL